MVDTEWALMQIEQVFHSEDHLKLILASELAQMYGQERVRLEWNPAPGVHVDIGVRRGEVTVPIELKYKTKEATVHDETFGEAFKLTSQGAHPKTHYRVFRDIERVESIVADQGRYGYVVLLTNDTNYWTPPTSPETLYDDFRLHEGRVAEGTQEWRETKGWMRNAGIAESIELYHRYTFEWTDYEYRNDIGVEPNAKFRVLTVRIG